MDDSNLNLRSVSRCYFTTTKRWWIWTWVIRLGAFLAAVPAIFWPSTAMWCAVNVGVLSFLAEICSIMTTRKKGFAEGILRKLDLRDSFGWHIQNAEVADLLVGLSNRDQKRLQINSEPDDYFASSDKAGPRRALENLEESSWWSKHLSKYMGIIVLTLTIVLISISIVALLITSKVFTDEGTSGNLGQIVISVLLLVVSLGLISLTIDYFAFAYASADCEKRASSLLRENADQREQAIKLFSEYHLARSSAPLIPDLLWSAKNDSLNKAWEEFVQMKRVY